MDFGCDLKSILAPAVRIARDAGEKLQKKQSSASVVNRKDFVTDADQMSHRFIAQSLCQLTPDVEIYSEESGTELAETNDWNWIVDPLDGTVNYFHRDSYWGVSIALAYRQVVELAVCSFPAIGELDAALRPSRLLIGSSTLRVREDRDLSQAQIWTDHIKGSVDPVLDILGRLARHTLYPQIRLCCSASLAAVACGRIAGYVHPAPKPEDFAAAAFLVEMAGGKVTDIQGNPWTVFSKSIVATNGLLHEQLLEVLNS